MAANIRPLWHQDIDFLGTSSAAQAAAAEAAAREQILIEKENKRLKELEEQQRLQYQKEQEYFEQQREQQHVFEDVSY